MNRFTRVRELAGRPRAEPLLAAAALALLAAIALAHYLRHGGFIYDDWSTAATMHFHGFGTLATHVLDAAAHRPLSAIYYPVVEAALGSHEHWHLVLVAVLRVGLSLVLFVLLRELRFDRLSAGAAAALALLNPWDDSTLLWGSTGHMTLAVVLWLAGLLVALRALRSGSRRAHALAVALYLASILLYEIALVVVLLSGLLYLGRAPRREALRRWAIEVAAVGLAVLLFTSRLLHPLGGDDVHAAQGLGGTLRHLGTIVDQGLTVTAAALVPFGAPGRVAVALGALLLVLTGAVVAWRAPDAELRRELRRWLAACALGAAIVAGGWVVLAVADPYYSPGQLGVGNRINIVACVGLAVLAIALVRLATALAFGALPRDRERYAALLTLLVTASIAGAYLDHLDTDRSAWENARSQQTVVLQALRNSMAPPPPGTTLIARGFNLWAAPGVPVFAAYWDLDGAVKLMWRDPTLRAWPAPRGALSCARTGIAVTGISKGRAPARYGHTILADLTSGARAQIATPAVCRVLARTG